jgi:hypothetical protein
VVRHPAVQTEPAEPAIGEVQVDLFAQSPLGPDAAARTMLASATKPSPPTIPSAMQRRTGGNVLLQAEAVEQRFLPDPPLAYHGPVLRHQED